jgi:polysaccharide export outer membrane protein
MARMLGQFLCTACLAASLCGVTGCHTLPTREEAEAIRQSAIPRELSKVTLPPYVVEPPDILLIEARKVVPKPPYRLEPLDAVYIRATGVLPDAPIDGVFGIDEQGFVDLGPAYGRVKISGKSVDEATAEIEGFLKKTFAAPKVSVSLVQMAAIQQIVGEHLVRPDGTVSLGTYGSVRVAGLTLEQAEKIIENHLKQYLEEPDVTVDVLAYNSKWVYVIFDGAGSGEQVVRVPVTGNETVLDVIAMVGGLPLTATRHSEIWVARPAPPDGTGDQVLPVDWVAITQGGSPETNYQLLPGDRIYVKADFWYSADGLIARVTAPVERLFGFSLFGHATVRAFQFGHRGRSGGVGGGFFGF